MALYGLTRILGITVLFLVICVITTSQNPSFVDTYNITSLLRWTAMAGLLALGVAFVIITGGIDLSIGSVVALTGVVLMTLLQANYYHDGETVTIVDRFNQGDARHVLLDKPPPDFEDLDKLTIAVPRRGTIELTIDGPATQAIREPNQLVVTGPIEQVPRGSEAKLLHYTLMNPLLAVGLTLLVGVGIGLLHGVLIGYAKLQPFIVTLCGLMAYRGLARMVSEDKGVGVGQHHSEVKYLASGEPIEVPIPFIRWMSEGRWSSTVTDQTGAQTQLPFWEWVSLPMPMLILLVLAIASAIFLHKTTAGRYLMAMGRNAEAARFSGINTKRVTVLAYVLCSVFATLGGMLFALDLNSVKPFTHGNFYELYAITAAVLGGCSLRGGVGSVAGVIIGTAVMRSLYNAIDLLKIPSYWEFIIIGSVLLLGVMIDEMGRLVIRAWKTRRRRGLLRSQAPET